MNVFDPDDKPHEKLQLEYSGGGPNSRARTAVGAGDGDNRWQLTSRMLAEPFWFKLIQGKPIAKYRQAFNSMTLEEGLNALLKVNVPSVGRLALGLKWGFINADEDGFTYLELDELLIDQKMVVDPKFMINLPATSAMRLKFRNEELARVEARSVYLLWKSERSTHC